MTRPLIPRLSIGLFVPAMLAACSTTPIVMKEKAMLTPAAKSSGS